MSVTQAGSLANARAPLNPWQYIAIFALVLGSIAFLWWLIRGSGDFWRHKPAHQIERSDTSSAPAFVGLPDAREVAARSASAAVPTTSTPPPDETAAWASPTTWSPQTQLKPVSAGETKSPNDPVEVGHSDSMLLADAVAHRIKHPMYIIPKGTVMSCNQLTKIDTSAGGNILVTAILDKDVWGIGGQMVLLDKGTELIGELGHGMVNGLDRLQVVWREARTPSPYNIRVSLDSPAAGPLGEGGLDGDVNRHLWDKIKGVLLFTLIQSGTDIAQAALAARGTTSISVGSSGMSTGSQQAGNILLESMINIPDTITRDQGQKCSAFLARDLDFSKIYSARITK